MEGKGHASSLLLDFFTDEGEQRKFHNFDTKILFIYLLFSQPGSSCPIEVRLWVLLTFVAPEEAAYDLIQLHCG